MTTDEPQLRTEPPREETWAGAVRERDRRSMPDQPVRYLLVKLEPGLDESRVQGIFHRFALMPGTVCVFDADLSGLPRDRLDVLTGVPTDHPRRAPKVKLG